MERGGQPAPVQEEEGVEEAGEDEDEWRQHQSRSLKKKIGLTYPCLNCLNTKLNK